MSGPNVRSSYPIVARAALRMSHGACRTARAHGGHILRRPWFLLWKANAWARAWGSYTSASLVSALKKQMRIMPIARARILGGSQCPGAAASRSQIGKFGFRCKKLRLDYRRGSGEVGRSGQAAIVAIENLALDAESRYFTVLYFWWNRESASNS